MRTVIAALEKGLSGRLPIMSLLFLAALLTLYASCRSDYQPPPAGEESDRWPTR